MVFMQDNAPCHKTNLVMDFLARNRIQTLDWPPQSPDLNPIENLWAIVKARRFKKFGIPRTRIELIEQIFEMWNAIDFGIPRTRIELIEQIFEMWNAIDQELEISKQALKRPNLYQ